PRRTLIKEEARATMEVPVLDEPVTVVVSVNGWVRTRQGHGHDPEGFGFKTGDALYATFECRTVDTLVALSNTGRSYSVGVSGLPGGRGDGTPMTSMVELEPGGRLVAFCAGGPNTPLVLGTAQGQGFLTRLEGLVGRNRSGKQFMTLDAGDEPSVLRVLAAAEGALAALTAQGRLLIFGRDEVKELPAGGRGVSLIETEGPSDRLVDLVVVPDAGLVVRGEGRAGKTSEQLLSRDALLPFVGKRARKGKPLGLKFKPRSLHLPPTPVAS
ncbi:MAG: DNA gyrase C-terminal beta-propeller domain-containing protein, partial [Burkholderiaceae bacterium]